jgi:RNA polymerase sigma factor (sigma-70 family)
VTALAPARADERVVVLAAAPMPPANDCAPLGRDDLVARFAPLAKSIAWRRHRRCPAADYGDFEGAAMLGLLHAAKRWDGLRPFANYAQVCIAGAIMDWQRTTWQVGTSGSIKWQRAKARAAGAEPPQQPSTCDLDDIARTLQLAARRLQSALRFEEGGFADAETRLTIESLLTRAPLSEQERHVIRQRLAGRRHGDIGADLGVSEARSRQIERSAVAALAAIAHEGQQDPGGAVRPTTGS